MKELNLMEGMRIGIVINTSWNIYNFRKELVLEFINRGHEVVAIAPRDDYSDKLVDLGCEYIELRMSNKGTNPLEDIHLFWNLVRAYRKSAADVFLQFTIKPNIYGSMAANFIGKPSVCNVSGLGTIFLNPERFSSKIARHLYRRSFRHPHHIFFQNEDDRQLFYDLKLIRHQRSSVLPGSGVNLEYFNHRHCPSPEIESNSPFQFLMISRVLKDKGMYEFVDACRMVERESEKPVIFKVVGQYDQSPGSIDHEDYKRFINEGIVQFVGVVEDVRVHICESDCVVLPSYREGTPKTLLEAMAMSKPIITTNVPGCKNVLKNEKNGYLCEPRSSSSLASAMLRMLKCSEAVRLQMGAEGREIVEQTYNQQIVINRYLEVINEI